MPGRLIQQTDTIVSSPITKQFLTNSVADHEMDKIPSLHSCSPAVSWAHIQALGPAANATSRAGLTTPSCRVLALTSAHQSESRSDEMTEAMKAQENLNAKSHPKADKRRRNCNGGAAQVRDA